MTSRYRVSKKGAEGVAAMLRDRQRQLDNKRGSAGIRSSIIRAADLQYQDEDGREIARFGTYTESINEDGVDEDHETIGMRVRDPATGILVVDATTDQVTGNRIFQAGARPNDDGDQIDAANLIARTINVWGTEFTQVASDTTLYLTSAVFDVRLSWTSTSNGANTYIDNDGRIWKSTSSLRYKQDIEDAEVDPADVLALRPRTWRDRKEVEQDPDTGKRFIGFIAEELDEHPTLRQFVEYDDEGRPDAISYDRLSVALVKLAQDQEQRLASLEARVEALESE